MALIHPLILCGGSGTRLWPRSRKVTPKPFLPLVGKTTLFEEALEHVADSALFAPPIIITGEAHLGHVEEQLGAGQHGATIIVEPEAKNTAATIALAAARLPRDAVMLVCPSDHHIADTAAFVDAASRAARLSAQGHLVSFGIDPKIPETGFGFILCGEALEGGARIERFVEKPDLERAKEFRADGRYSWNGGIFAFGVGQFMDELAQHRPDIASAVIEAVQADREDGIRFHPSAEIFATIDGESVDYAVMENTGHAAVVSADMGWSDIGNWGALFQNRAADGEGNVARGPAQLLDCTNVMVDIDGPRVSAVGLGDAIIVVNGDDVLVTTRAGAQKVGKLDGAPNQ